MSNAKRSAAYLRKLQKKHDDLFEKVNGSALLIKCTVCKQEFECIKPNAKKHLKSDYHLESEKLQVQHALLCQLSDESFEKFVRDNLIDDGLPSEEIDIMVLHLKKLNGRV